MSEAAKGTFENLFVELYAKDGVAEVFLNDFPVACAGSLPGGPTRAVYLPLSDARPVQQHLVAGPNSLRLVMRARPEDEDGLLDEGARARARIVRFKEGELIDSDAFGTVLTELSYPPAASASEASIRSVEVSFDPGFHRGRAIWEDAEVVTLDDAVVARVEETVSALADALGRGDELAFSMLLEPYARDLARAYAERPLARIDASHRNYARAFREGGRVTVAPREAWRPRLVAGGRMIEPRLADGTGVLVAEPPGSEPVDLPLYVGWVGGVPILYR